MDEINLTVTSNQADLNTLISQLNSIAEQIAAFQLTYTVASTPATPPVEGPAAE